MVELVIRLVFSLAVVLGMLLLLTRFSAKKFRGGANALVRVVHRQPLSRTSAVAVVTVGSRVLVVGTTEHQVQLLTELDPEEIELPSQVVAALPPVEEPAERWELATLDELFQPTGTPDVVGVESLGSDTEIDVVDLPDTAYAPKHAGTPAGATALPAAPGRARSFSRATAASRAADGALAGSILSAQTWKQAFAAASSRPRDAS